MKAGSASQWLSLISELFSVWSCSFEVSAVILEDVAHNLIHPTNTVTAHDGPDSTPGQGYHPCLQKARCSTGKTRFKNERKKTYKGSRACALSPRLAADSSLLGAFQRTRERDLPQSGRPESLVPRASHASDRQPHGEPQQRHKIRAKVGN